MDVLSLNLEPRAVTGKKVKELRRQGMIPVHLYGRKLPPLALQVEAQVLLRVLPRVATNIPLSVKTAGDGGENICFVREVQRHPVTEDVLHVDFLRVDVAQTIRADVPVVLAGTAPAVRQLGGTVLQPLQNILVEALPLDVPVSFEVDLSDLDDFEKAIYVRDISVEANVTVVTDPDEMIARVGPPRIEVEKVEEEGEVEEGAEAPTGEKPAQAEGETEG